MPATPTPPTRALLIGLVATLATVAIFSFFALRQVSVLRQLETDIIQRNRRDSLQLIRIQNNLNVLGLSIHDMLEDREGYGVGAWKSEFRRLRDDLNDAIQKEQTLTTRPAGQRQYLARAVDQFWRSADEVFAAAEGADTGKARRIIADSLHAQHASLTTIVARLLFQNHEVEEQAERRAHAIYDGVERSIYLFFIAMIVVTAAIGLVVAYYSRRLFEQVAALSQQRSTLARGLISVQEEVFRSVSRELHDDFGQILTAIGVMLKRLEKKQLPSDSPLREDVAEIRDIAQEALEKTRSFSQAIHPTILDDYGLERAIERHVQAFERQTGVATRFERPDGVAVAEASAIHIYRIVQEALTNVARHAKATQAVVRLDRQGDKLLLEIADNGEGIPENPNTGLGLIAMRERAELLRGSLRVKRNSVCGTLVSLEVPLE